MSVIAVKVKGRRIEIATDNQTTWGSNKSQKYVHNDNQVKSQGKIFQVNGMTIGCAGTVAHINLLQIFCKTHRPKEMERDSVLDWFIEFKEWAQEKAKINFNDISIHGIVIFEGSVFCFYDFMDVQKVTDFDAVGSGSWLAIGAMELGASASDAVKVAIKYDLYCGGGVSEIVLK